MARAMDLCSRAVPGRRDCRGLVAAGGPGAPSAAGGAALPLHGTAPSRRPSAAQKRGEKKRRKEESAMTEKPDLPLRVEDYALIGDCMTAALVGRNGSIDWLCWPRFDSDACFAALLGTQDNGRWSITPREVKRISRRYRGDTLVLETRFECAQGVAVLTDFMPPRSGHSHLV